jgi:vancomycin resistance protein YoaR
MNAAMDPDTFEVTPETYGYHFDLDAAKASLAQAEFGDTLEFPFSRITPDVTAQSLSSKLFCDILGSAKTPYKGKDSNNRNTNLAIACDAINGLVLLPGESFSYNDTLGERTADKGYKEAPSYVGGLTVDTLGGGICQVSSTLYYSTLFADMEILERHNHGYVSDYIDKGMDATVTWDGADFRFANNTNYPIRIEAWRADGYVNVQIVGTDERDYYIKMTYQVVESTPYDTVYEEMEADNEKGYKDGDVIVTPYRGYVVKAYKEKYSKATDELISKELESYNVYKKRDMVICRIVESTPPEDPT